LDEITFGITDADADGKPLKEAVARLKGVLQGAEMTDCGVALSRDAALIMCFPAPSRKKAGRRLKCAIPQRVPPSHGWG
jgi:hypothetical protein